MEPPFYKSADYLPMAHYYHKPDELSGFADLLPSWPSLSFSRRRFHHRSPYRQGFQFLPACI